MITFVRQLAIMKYIDQDDDTVTIKTNVDDLSALMDILNEVRNGPFAITEDEWAQVMAYPIDKSRELLDDLRSILDRCDSGKK